MVVIAILSMRRVAAPAGRADSTATRLVATGSYQVTCARSVLLADVTTADGSPGRHQAGGAKGQVDATPASTSRSPTRVDRSFSGHKAGGNPSQARAGLHDEQHDGGGASRQVKR
jgi:hypothetical protein